MAPPLIFAWGSNSCGQCCVQQDGAEVEPKPRCVNSFISRTIPSSTPVLSVASGEAHTLLLTSFGDVFGCGRGREGQLGLLPSEAGGDARGFVRVDALRAHRVVQIACGSMHSVAIAGDGQVFEWGLLLSLDKDAGDRGWVEKRSGLGKDFNEDLNDRQRRIVAASWSSYMRNSDSYSASDSEDGFDTTTMVSMLSDAECRRAPTHAPRKCSGLGGAVCRHAACGYAHTVLVADGGQLLAAGYGEKGQLGDGQRYPRARFAPVSLPPGLSMALAAGGGPAEAAPLACGLNHTVAIAGGPEAEGALIAWGYGVFGQLGLGPKRKEQCLPFKVSLPDPVAQIACGDNHTVAITTEGELFVFGHRDAVGGKSHQQRFPEKRQDLSLGSGEPVEAVWAGGTGSFAILRKEKAGRHPSLTAWGYNQRFQLGRYTAVLELTQPGPVAFPALAGASVRAFSAGASHCMAVLESPSCCVLPLDDGKPFFGSAPLIAAFNGEAPFDVRVKVRAAPCGREDGASAVGAHRCVLRARCAALAGRLQAAEPVQAERAWTLDLSAYSSRCVKVLLEYLYTDYCRMGSEVAAELRPLAEELQLKRLLAGISIATETDSVDVGMCWVRSAGGKWEQIAEDQRIELDATSTYARDLECLVVEGELADVDAHGFVELLVRQLGGDPQPPRRVRAARALLLTVDFFRALLEGGFREAAGLREDHSEDGGVTPGTELIAEDAGAFVLCLRMLATGSYDLMPSDPEEALSVLAEAHRLQLPEIVAAAEAALGELVAGGQCNAAQLAALDSAASLFDLPKLARNPRGRA